MVIVAVAARIAMVMMIRRADFAGSGAIRVATTSRVAGHGAAGRVITLAATYHTVWLTLWYVAIAALIAERFWDYWVTVLT